jgi:predicted dehydrogenase
VAIIGAGRRAQSYARCLAARPEAYRCVGVADLVLHAAEALARQLGCDAVAELDSLFEQCTPDAVFVTTPASVHHAISMIALERGIHTLCETPIALTVPLAREVERVAESSGTVFMVAENAQRDSIPKVWLSVAASGLLGSLSRVICHNFQAGTHATALMRSLVGAPAIRVQSLTQESPVELPSPKREHWSAGLITYANGCLGSFESCSLTPSRQLGRHKGLRMELHGSNGMLTGRSLYLSTRPQPFKLVDVTKEDGASYTEICIDGPATELWPAPFSTSTHPDAALLEILDEFSAQVHARRATSNAEREAFTPSYTIDDAIHDLSTQLALEESARQQGQPVNLPLTQCTTFEAQLHQRFADRHGVDPFDAAAASRLRFSNARPGR